VCGRTAPWPSSRSVGCPTSWTSPSCPDVANAPSTLEWTPSDVQLERIAWRRRQARRRGTIALVSTVVVFGAAAVAIVNSPGWERVRQTFFDWSEAKAAAPEVLDGFWTTVQMFLLA